MKKEKTIRTYQRRTKTGKVVTVKQHTAKYDAAEALKEAAKKKGAGEELEASKKKGELDLAKIDAFKGDPNELSDKERQAWQILTGNYPAEAESKLRKMKSLAKVWAYVDAKSKKKSSTKAPKETKVSKDATDPYSAHGFTKDEFKEWYEGTGSKADKKVEKALKKAMGTKAYNALSDKAADEYTSGGAHRFFTKGLEEMKASTSASTKSVTPTKETKEESLKVGSSIQMGNSTSLGKGKKETFKVLAVQKANKQDRELGNTEAAWVQRKDGSVTLALKDSEKGWMYDDTWTDFTDRKHPYAKSLEAAGYSFKKAQGKGGKYWEVSKSKSHYDPYKDLKEAYKDYKDSIKADSSAEGKKRAAQNLLGEMGVSMQGANAKTKNLLMQIHKETGLDISKHKIYGKLPEAKAYSSKETKADSSKIATPNSIEEIAKAGLKRVSVPSGKGDKKSAIYYTDGKQVYEPGEDGYLKKISKNKMVPTARKLIDPPKSRASHKENSMGFSSLDWEATYGGGATGVDSDAAMRKIDKAARKYLGAKAYNKWAKYQDDSDDTGGSYKGFIKQLEKFKASEANGGSEKPRTKSVMTPHGRTTMISRKEIGTVGRTKYYQDSAGNVYKRNNRVGVSGDGMYSKLSGAKAKEVLGQLKSSAVDKAPKTPKSKTPRRGSKAAYEAAQKAKASLTSYVDGSPYKRVLKSMNTYGGQVNKNELIGKLVKKGLSHAEASKIAGQFATKVKTEFTKSRQYRPGAK